MTLEETWRWLPALDGDPRALAIKKRHYSTTNFAPLNRQFIPPGEKMLLMTLECDAIFAWVKNLVERYDHQEGVCCTVFRNESRHLSSSLIEEADGIADEKWPSERHFTYVDGGKIQRFNSRHKKARPPGYCFIKAGWRECGYSKEGLVILERPLL